MKRRVDPENEEEKRVYIMYITWTRERLGMIIIILEAANHQPSLLLNEIGSKLF